MSTGPRTQFDLVESFWRELLTVDQQPVERARRAEARRRVRRMLAYAVLTLLAAAAVALAARALLRGEDAKRPNNGSHVLELAALPGTMHVLPTRAADPDGGPPWGLRAFLTESEACFQLGRIVDGRIVALGIDGRFDNDGRFHVRPIDFVSCAGHRPGRPFRLAAAGAASASGYGEPTPCIAPDATGPPGMPTCDPSQARTVFFGSAGPGIVEVSLEADGTELAQRLVDERFRAYLFVLRESQPENATIIGRRSSGERCLMPCVIQRQPR